MITYGRASEQDMTAALELLRRYFDLSDLKGREQDPSLYYVALDGYKVIGVAKVLGPDDSDFEEWEVQYTVVDKEYQRQGIAEELIRRITAGLPGKIYGTAWRTWDAPDKAHIHSTLIKLGFELVEKGNQHWAAKHYCKHMGCIFANNRIHPTCECWTDIYMLDKDKQEVQDV